MQTFEYRVVFIDYRGRISIEGRETLIANERRTTFVRRQLDTLGAEGWDLIGIQPLSPHSAYYIFKRPGGSSAQHEGSEQAASKQPGMSSGPATPDETNVLA